MIIERMKETRPGETICLSYEECEEVLKLIEDQEEWIAIMSEGGWIPVGERLPKSNEIVLVAGIEAINNENVYSVKYFDGRGFNPLSAPSVLYTYWMPLPKLPKEGGQE